MKFTPDTVNARETLGLLSQLGKTGVLEAKVDSVTTNTRIFFVEGDIVFAQSGALRGCDAVKWLAQSKDASGSFQAFKERMSVSECLGEL
jgi:hypothetical protein